MVSSVSNINFRGEAAPVNVQDLINSQGKFSSIPESKADSFEKSGSEDKKSHTGAVIGTTLALLAAAYVGLGLAVGKGKLKPVEGESLKFMEKVQNFFHRIGQSGVDLWSKVGGNKAAKAAAK